MAYRIDMEALRRYQDDGLVTALSEAQQRRFEQTIESALDARSDAGGSSRLDETEERIFIVEDGDSLARIAEEHNVDFDELLDLNRREDLPNPNSIDPGDVVFVPTISPQEAATSARGADGVPLAEDDFARSLRERGNELEYADDPSAVDYDAEIGQLSSDITSYLESLPADERQAALQRFYDRDWTDAGPTQMAIEQAAKTTGIELEETSHAGPEAEAEAREIISDAEAVDDPDEALEMLENKYDAAPPAVQAALDRSSGARAIAEAAGADIIADAEAANDPAEALRQYESGYAEAPERVQDALDRSSEAQAIIDDAADWAAEPINDEIDDSERPAASMLETMQRLDTLTEGLSPELVAEVVDAMVPRIEESQQRLMDNGYAGYAIGPQGTTTLMTVLDRVAGTPTGDAAIQQLAEHALFDMNTLRASTLSSVSQGDAIPAYALAVATLDGMHGDFTEQIVSAVEQFGDHAIAGQAEDYAAHLDELSFLAVNGGAAMTEEQLETAITDYMQANPEWQAQLETLQGQLADSGVELLTQIQQLQSLPDDLRADHQARIDGLLDDSNSQLAVSTALQERPELVRGEAGDELIATFTELGITGDDNPLAMNLAGAYLRENVILPAADIDPSDLASLQDAHAQLDEALDNNPQFATLLGISSSDLNEISDLFHGLVPTHDSNFDPQRYSIDVARNLNNTLDKIDAIFRDTPFNRAFRTSAMAIVGSGLANAIQAYGEAPSLRNALQVALDSARVGVDGAQLVDSLLKPSEGSGATNALKLGGKFVHLLGAGLAGVDALARLSRGDVVGAGLNAAVAGGVGYSVFGTSSLAGPIGFAVATAATLGLFAWDGIRNVQHNNRFQTPTTAEFLSHAGFNEEAAQALSDQSGEGYSAVPLLMRYGELHGLEPEDTVEWINAIADDENGPVMLTALRDNLHNTLDKFDGDITQFDEHADGFELASPSLGESRSGTLTPRSAFELDAILPQLDIESPQAYA
ncbi:LysM domain-containing protein [Modicisalibacter muralis]|uniref:LysM domain-containing protein n=1 Tax=Modicisalibacter muralis TaxID=119000 RepID=A0A1G9MF53_9GAMM|nr:LysM domain-containing protein [Halomonas muralis]SDL72631.1 LysM domain-containing protein [Halomonas muralis]